MKRCARFGMSHAKASSSDISVDGPLLETTQSDPIMFAVNSREVVQRRL